jgi:sugar/nucleoside kinase (ribokinase family)
VHPAGTRRAVNLMGPDGRRVSCFDARQPADATLPEEVWGPLVRGADRVHLAISGWVRNALGALSRYDRPFSTDLHDWDGENPYHVPFAEAADVVLLSAVHLGSRRDTMLRAILDRGRAGVVVATGGADGAWLLERGAAAVRHTPAAPLPGPLVDSNGAGDAFAAGFLHALTDGAAPADAMVAGTVAGAYACTIPGTAGGFVDRAGLADGVAALRR